MNCWLCSSHRFYLYIHGNISTCIKGLILFYGRCATKYAPEVETWFTWKSSPVSLEIPFLETIILWFHVKLWEGNPMDLVVFPSPFHPWRIAGERWCVNFQARFFRLVQSIRDIYAFFQGIGTYKDVHIATTEFFHLLIPNTSRDWLVLGCPWYLVTGI